MIKMKATVSPESELPSVSYACPLQERSIKDCFLKTGEWRRWASRGSGGFCMDLAAFAVTSPLHPLGK